MHPCMHLHLFSPSIERNGILMRGNQYFKFTQASFNVFKVLLICAPLLLLLLHTRSITVIIRDGVGKPTLRPN